MDVHCMINDVECVRENWKLFSFSFNQKNVGKDFRRYILAAAVDQKNGLSIQYTDTYKHICIVWNKEVGALKLIRIAFANFWLPSPPNKKKMEEDVCINSITVYMVHFPIFNLSLFPFLSLPPSSENGAPSEKNNFEMPSTPLLNRRKSFCIRKMGKSRKRVKRANSKSEIKSIYSKWMDGSGQTVVGREKKIVHVFLSPLVVVVVFFLASDDIFLLQMTHK